MTTFEQRCRVEFPCDVRDDLALKKPVVKDLDDISVGTSSTNGEASSSFHLNTEVLKSEQNKRKAIVVVDPWSTGNVLCAEIRKNDIDVIVLWEKDVVRSKTLSASVELMSKDFSQTVLQLEELREKFNLLAVLPGSETGVPLAEKMASALHLPTNPQRFGEARRNKYLMAEALRSKGVRAVKQTITVDVEEAVRFVNEMNPVPFRVILKPNMGAGSDDVFLCKTMEELKEKFKIINGKLNSLGLRNDGVLVQEYLAGIEYVLDTVSRDGKHQLSSIWVYDKREANGRFNVYFGSFPLVNNSPLTNQLVQYVFQVLDALEIQNGPGHAEIKMTETGPCLIEIGSRCHGGGGTWLEMANRVWGLNQISMVVNGFANDNLRSFHCTEFPTHFREFGVVLDFVQYEDGCVDSIPGDAIVRSLPSFHAVHYYVRIGDKVVKTVDCNTSPGQVVLIHSSEEQVIRDYTLIHNLLHQKNGFFKLKNV